MPGEFMATNLTPITELASHLITRETAAKTLGVGLRTIDRFIQSGDIPFVKLGRSVRINPSELSRFCDARVTRIDPKRREANRGTNK